MSRRGGAALLAAAWLTFASACAEPPTGESGSGERQQAWWSGSELTRGHEDLTRFAVEFANQLLASELGVADFFSLIPEGEPCVGTSIPLLRGNCATDSPDDTMTSHYNVPASAWQTAPELQVLHFLRNYVGATDVQDARQACDDALALLVAVSKLGAEAWAADDTAGGAYWFGHALHIVQDSFAPPHTVRTGELERELADVCSYEREVAGVCLHPFVSLDDRVWLSDAENDPLECTIGTARTWDCLTPQAQSAALASAGYLRVVGRYVHDPSGELGAALETWMHGGAADDYVDYFHCETLPGDPDAGPPDAAPDDSGGSDAADAGVPAPMVAPTRDRHDDGCSCRAATGAKHLPLAWLTLLGVALLCIRRRSR